MSLRPGVVIAVLGLGVAFTPQARAGSAPQATLAVPAGAPVRVDGSLKQGEWTDADSLTITVAPEWAVLVLVKHSGPTLYVAFSNLRHGSSERYPEVLIDVAGDRALEWQQDDWWLHASYSDCHARGRFDVYDSCASTRSGWSANNFPLRAGVVEFQVDLRAFGARADTSSAGPGLGLAFDVMEQKNGERVSSCWPPSAQLMVPRSWARAWLAPAGRATPGR